MTRRRFLAALAAAGAWLVAAVVAACTPGPSLLPIDSTPTPPPAPSPSPIPVAPSPSAAGLGLRRKIGRMVVAGFRGTTIADTDPILVAIRKGELGGVILFDRDSLTKTAGRNITSPTQLAALTKRLHGAYPRDGADRLLVAIDQEGGYVARLNASDGYAATPSEASLGATGDPERTRAAAATMAGWMAAAGIDFDLAPVVDLALNPDNPAIAKLGRSYGTQVPDVVAHATAAIEAFRAKGVLAAIKHFPGEGSATGNTDLGGVDVTDTWSQTELEPFSQLIAVDTPDAVMVGHIVDRRRDPVHPASLSEPTVSGVLRETLGWTGVVVSDDLQAVAITSLFGAPQAIELAILAGVDLLLFANQQVYDPEIADHVVSTIERLVRSGRVPESRIDASVARIVAMLGRSG